MNYLLKFYQGTISPKRPPSLDAVVTKTSKYGKPNEAKVDVRVDYQPVLPLNGYRSALEVGAIIRVKTTFNKKISTNCI